MGCNMGLGQKLGWYTQGKTGGISQFCSLPQISFLVRYKTKNEQQSHSFFVGADEGNKSEPFYRPELLKSSLFNIRLKINLC
ncbi:MAG: hypothetical protein J6B37_07685, partial [Clostridia bacterium]|nr:hypothetical protein [Clostridia bacterium]